MVYKLFTYLSLTSALLTTMNSCFAMEKDPSHDDRQSRISKLLKNITDGEEQLSKLSSKITEWLDVIPDMKPSLEKVNAYGEMIEAIDSHMSLYIHDRDDIFLRCFLTKALCYKGSAIRETNSQKGSLNDRINHLSEALPFFMRSFKLQELILHDDKAATDARILPSLMPLLARRASQDVADVFSDINSLYRKQTQEEREVHLSKDAPVILNFYSEILRPLHRLNASMSNQLEKHCSSVRSSCLQYCASIDDHILVKNMNCTIGVDLGGYNSLIKEENLLKCMLSNTHFLLKIEQNLNQGKKKLDQELLLDFYIYSFNINYCKTLKNAGDIALKLDIKNEFLKNAYEKRGQEHLSLAYSTYKKNIYKGEYRNDPTKEKTFIEAILESCMGKEAPLKKFYDDLVQERRERKKRQGQRQEQANAQQIKKEQQEALAQHIRDQKEQANTQQPPKRREAKQAAEDNQTSPSEPSLTFCSFDETKPDFEATPSTNVKKKRRGVADPSKAQPPQKVLRNEPAPVVQDQPMIILHPKHYQVFLSLIGESHDRNITCDQVIHLLGNGLSCSITPGGNHRKATAQNGAEWTIPPAWDGPIHSGYRHQLMDFLLSSMELDPAFVRARGD